MKTTEVLIVGAGPAGSMCGCLLKKAGVDCVLVDHATFPRDKICGGGLTSKCWHLLEHLLPDFHYDFNPVSHVTLDIEGKVHCEFDIAEPIRIVARKVFDHSLLQHYQSLGGAFMKGAFQTVEESPSQLIVTLKSGEQIACRYLVGADGSNSRVRHYLTPNEGYRILAMEQYVPKSGRNAIDVGLSLSYGQGGYYYRFPGTEFDVVGFGDSETTPEKFRSVMRDKGIPDGKARGAFVYLSNDYPLKDHIILIGDAGGFANRATCEGLYDAFMTARHAAMAISTGRPFREVNAPVFKKMKREEKVARRLFTKTSFWLISRLCHYPGIVRWIFDAKMRRETWT